MSATNKTQHYNLPQFVAGDIPAWMTDVNNAMATIDGAIYDVASDEATVGESVAQLGSRVTSAENTVASLGTTVQSVQGDVAENTADIGTLEGNVNGLGTRMTAVEGKTTAVEGNLTANNKRFQFAYDSTEQKYGYVLDGVFHPFDDSADFQNELYEALQYSGLVEEGDTVEEMLHALATYFPELWNVVINTSLLLPVPDGSYLAPNISQGTNTMTMSTPGDGTQYYGIVWVDHPSDGTSSVKIAGTASGINNYTGVRIVKHTAKVGDQESCTPLHVFTNNESIDQTYTLNNGEYIGVFVANNGSPNTAVSITFTAFEQVS